MSGFVFVPSMGGDKLPVIQDITVVPAIDEIVRWSGGAKPGRTMDALTERISEVMADMHADQGITGAVAYAMSPVTRTGAGGSWVVEGTKLQVKLAAETQELAVAVCTIGSRFEEEASRCFGNGELMRGLVVDAIGTAALDALSMEVRNMVSEEAESRGYHSGSYISPGMPGFPISEQEKVLSLVPASKIGLSLTAAGVMVPHKSVSMVFGLGEHVRALKGEVCARCNLKKTCRYRSIE